MPYKNKEQRAKYQREWRKKNKEKVKEYQRNYVKKNIIKYRTYQKKYRKQNDFYNKYKEKSKEYQKRWKKKNPSYVKIYKRNKKMKDKDFLIKERLRSHLRRIFVRYILLQKKNSSSKYGIDYLKIIENLKPFPKDLENYEIHHIKPLKEFKFVNEQGLINEKEIKEAFKPENHQLVSIEEHKKIHSKRKEEKR